MLSQAPESTGHLQILLQQLLSSSTPANQQSKRNSVASTRSKRTHREVRFGSYVLGSTLGEGEFGKVKLGWRKDGKTPSQAAIKLIRRESIPRGSERESKVHREINSLKRLAHPNIVRLEEVLQNDKYIGIVLEYASGGELFDYILENRYLKDSMACKLFAQLVSGVDYMHSKGIVHRDLKLENLLLDKHKNIVISDFGFVNSFRDGNELMKTSCGSPCYAAPELVVSSEPYEARKVDVWSCGVILYAMLAGYLPFDDDPQNPDGDNIARLYHYITHTPLTFPEYVQPMPRDLLRKIIVSNPKKRIGLKEARSHTWLAPHAPFLSVTPTEWDRSYRSARARLHSNIDSENRRHSLMEGRVTTPSSSQGFLMNPHHARSYSTQNVAQKLYSPPAAPQTSSSHAIASIPISASTHEFTPPSIPTLTTAGYSPNQFASPTSSSSPELATLKLNERHRSMSSASIALQAVVQADVEERSHNNKPVVFVKPELPHLNSKDKEKKTTEHTNNSHSSLGDIDESSTIDSYHSMLPPAGLPKSGGSALSANNGRLPIPHIKPRPTSYHPGSYSMGNSSGNDYYSLLPFNLTSSSSLKNSPISSSPEHSPIMENTVHEKRKSWSKISEPLVDMSIANGTLSSSDKSEKRKSIAVDSLSNAIESLSSKEPKDVHDVENELVVDSETGVTEASGDLTKESSVEDKDKAEDPIKDKDTVLSTLKEGTDNKPVRTKTNNSASIDNKENKSSTRAKRFSFFYSSSTTTTVPHTSTTTKVNESRPSTNSGSSSTSSSGRKILEPSNEINIIRARPIDNDITRKQNRMSMIGIPSSQSNLNGKGKESSALKKVVDFFKRRSMRV